VVDGERHPWAAHPRADEILQRVALRLVAKRTRPELRAALDGSGEGRSLPPDARALHALLLNRDPDRTFELAARLDPSDRGVLRRFSPSSVAGRIEVPVVAMHSVDDPAVPFGEAVRLSRALPGSRLVEVRLFRHVDLRGDSTREVIAVMGDLLRAWRFATWVVGAQE
jgi:pimeloyl-ACP methyl ester carboxylesterase